MCLLPVNEVADIMELREVGDVGLEKHLDLSRGPYRHDVDVVVSELDLLGLIVVVEQDHTVDVLQSDLRVQRDGVQIEREHKEMNMNER